MIASRHTGIERTSTLQGQKIEMSIDLSREAVASMMRSMIDLYEDQELACIREYSTNAWDAHVMAGCTDRPIEVELPGTLSPFLTIRDFGIGLSAQDIVEVYSKYGASTKRDSNEVQGMLGYGCKAALSYTPQFTVTSVKDGVRAQIAVSREDDGGGSMQIVDQSPTTDPNGTTIQIPVRRDNDFETRARLFFSFWEAGTVLVNGSEPERISGLPIGKNITVIDMGEDQFGRRNAGKHYVVMGKVAYPASFPRLDIARGYGIVARVAIGDVNFTPSREGLMTQDPDTMATLSRIEAEFLQEAPAAIQAQIDKAPTATEALETLVRYRAMLSTGGRRAYVYKGQDLPSVYDFRGDGGAMISTRKSTALSSCTKLWEYAVNLWPRTLWMENHDATKFTPSHKRKILQWCASNGRDHLDQFVHLDGPVPADVKRYIDPANIVQWADIKAVKLPVVASSGMLGYSNARVKQITGSFDVWVDGDYKGETAAKDFDTNKPMFYKHGNTGACRRYQILLTHIHPSSTFVCVPGNRLAKFQRDFPKAIEAGKAVEDSYKVWRSSLTKDVLMALAMEDAGLHDAYKRLDATKVNDPDIKRAIRLSKIDLTKALEQRKLFQSTTYQRLGLPIFTDPLENYPLVQSRFGRYNSVPTNAVDHFYIYVNAAYEARTKGA